MDYIELDLSTMNKLNDEVKALLPSLVKSLENEKDKASLNITISLERVKDTDSMLQITHSVKPTYPKRANVILARQDFAGNLSHEITPTQRNLFPQEVKENARTEG